MIMVRIVRVKLLVNVLSIVIALISGTEHNVTDAALTASSMVAGRYDHGPQCSRLGVAKPKGCFSFSWQADHTKQAWWIQVGPLMDITTYVYTSTCLKLLFIPLKKSKSG